jgi:hypothetical protein
MFIITVTYRNDLPFDHEEQFAAADAATAKEKAFDFIAANPGIVVKTVGMVRTHVPLAFA